MRLRRLPGGQDPGSPVGRGAPSLEFPSVVSLSGRPTAPEPPANFRVSKVRVAEYRGSFCTNVGYSFPREDQYGRFLFTGAVRFDEMREGRFASCTTSCLSVTRKRARQCLNLKKARS
jgi:hypothetical protein